MTAFLERESASDLDLISAARSGDDEAVAELYERHRGAATRYARGLADPTTAEDLVAEAFARLLEGIRSGGGPTVAFRPYLLRTVHNVYVNHVRRDSRHAWVEDADELDDALPDPADQRQESVILASAFAALPERWQAVLWHTAVEGEDHETVGRRLGLKANAVAALAFRSRDGLRRAYLEAHLGAVRDEACIPFRDGLAAYVRGRVHGRRRQRIEDHLAQCPDCTAGYLELDALGADLGAVLAPAVLGAAAAGYAATTAGATGAGGTGLFGGRRGLRTSMAVVAAAAVIAALAGTGFALLGRSDRPVGPTSADPPAAIASPMPATDSPVDPPASASTEPPVSPEQIVGWPSPTSTTAPAVLPTRTPPGSPIGEPTPTPRPSTTPATPPETPSATPSAISAAPADPIPVAPTALDPTQTPPETSTETPSQTPSQTPTETPTIDPTTHEDLAIGSGSHSYYGPHHHVQMSVRALLDPTVITLDVRGLQSFQVHPEPSYLPATCERAPAVGDRTRVTCELPPGEGTFAIDLVVSGVLDVVARVSAADNADPNPGNDELVFPG